MLDELKIILNMLEKNQITIIKKPYVSFKWTSKDEDGSIIHHERREKIGNIGAKNIANLLAKNTSLTELDLCQQNISDIGAEYLVNALIKNKSVTKLVLSRNTIINLSANWIQLLQKNKHLRILDLSKNKLNADGIVNLANGLATNHSLTELNLAHNSLKNIGIQTIANSLQLNRSIQTIILSWNNFNSKAVDYFNETAVKNNYNLQEVKLKCLALNPIKQAKSSKNMNNRLKRDDQLFGLVKSISHLYYSSPSSATGPSYYFSNLPAVVLLNIFSILGKNMVPAAKPLEVNRKIEDIFENAAFPEIFENIFPRHSLHKPKLISIRKIATNKTQGKFNYIVTVDGELKISKVYGKPGGSHIDLAKGKPVKAAGEVKFIDGKIKYIDNASGHYMPYGLHACKAAKSAFSHYGFDTKQVYIEKIWVNQDAADPTIGSWKRK